MMHPALSFPSVCISSCKRPLKATRPLTDCDYGDVNVEADCDVDAAGVGQPEDVDDGVADEVHDAGADALMNNG